MYYCLCDLKGIIKPYKLKPKNILTYNLCTSYALVMLLKAVNSIAFAFQREELLMFELLSGFISVWPKMEDFGTATAQ